MIAEPLSAPRSMAMEQMPVTSGRKKVIEAIIIVLNVRLGWFRITG
jgi:hypothetical protein